MSNKKTNNLPIKKIVNMYEKELKSPYEIAEELGTYSLKIRRILIKAGVKIRSKSESQKIAIKSGRLPHPTEGRERTEEEKISISERVSGAWKNISDEERERRSKMVKAQFDAMSDEEKEAIQKKRNKAIRRTAKEGSKIEHYLLEKLGETYDVLFHKKGIGNNSNIEVDLLIPSLKLAIEVDGLSHFEPIYGKEAFEKTVAADNKKNGELLRLGYSIIRVKYTIKNLSERIKRDTLSDVLNTIDKAKKLNKPQILDVEMK